jgi:hypothetical protein
MMRESYWCCWVLGLVLTKLDGMLVLALVCLIEADAYFGGLDLWITSQYKHSEPNTSSPIISTVVHAITWQVLTGLLIFLKNVILKRDCLVLWSWCWFYYYPQMWFLFASGVFYIPFWSIWGNFPRLLISISRKKSEVELWL